VSRVQRELHDADVDLLSSTYRAWTGASGADAYEDIPGFCKSASLEEVRDHNYVLTPGRYVGARVVGKEDENFETRFPKLLDLMEDHVAEGARLDSVIRQNLQRLRQG